MEKKEREERIYIWKALIKYVESLGGVFNFSIKHRLKSKVWDF